MKGKATISLDLLFSPVTIALGLYVPLFALFLITKPSVFSSEFSVVKAENLAGLSYLTLALLAFLFGALAGMRFVRRGTKSEGIAAASEDDNVHEQLLRGLRVALLLSIAAYVAWFGLGAVRAGGVGALISQWLASPEQVKAGALRTIPGVTTLTQLSVAAVPLAVTFGLLKRRGVMPLVIVIFVLAFVRSFVFSERLAILELVVPIIYLALSKRVVEVHKAVLVALASGVAVLGLFTATEARRSYVYTQNLSATRVTARFFGYYLTSENNAVVVVNSYPAATPLANTGEMFWQFPLVTHSRVDHVPVFGTFSLRYQDLFGKDPAQFWQQAFPEHGLSYEYNVFTTPGFLAADFGWAGLVGVALLGLYSGVLYKRARVSRFHRALYALWLVGLLEFMRIMYFFDTRALPAYAVFVVLYLVLRRHGRVVEWRLPRRATTAPAVEATSR
jgi:oligosaccharide repeat unit polymerase